MSRTTPFTLPRKAPQLALLLVLALALLLTTGCSTTSITEENPEVAVNQIIPAKLAIVHTGGIAGAYAQQESSMGMSAIAALKHSLEDEGYEVLLLDSGNSLTGTLITDLSDGETPIAFMNAAKYDALTLGSRELSLGFDVLRRRAAQSDFLYLSANAKPTSDAKSPLKENTTFVLADGRRVGVFGLTSPSVRDDLLPLAADDFTIEDGELSDIAHEQVAALRSEGCRLVICLANLGTDNEGTPRAQRLASQVSGINVLLDVSEGGPEQYSVTDASEDRMLLVETAQHLTGASVVTWETGTLSVRFVDASTQDTRDEQVEALVNQTVSEVDQYLAEVVATADRTPSLSDGSTPSGLTQLVTDSLLWEAKRSSKQKPDAALLTSGTLQVPLPKGDITNQAILQTMPQPLTRLCTIEVKGSDLQAVLQPLLAAQPVYNAATPYVAGIELKREQGEDNQPREATIEKVGGEAFSPTATYVIVTCEGLIAPEDTFHALAEAADKSPEDVGTTAARALSSYLERECKGKVPEHYLEAPPLPEAQPAPEEQPQ